MIKRLLFPVVVAATLATSCASAPSARTAADAPATTGDTLYPGDARVDARRLASGAESIGMSLERPGQPSRAIGSATDVLGLSSLDGAPVLLRVQTVQRGTATLIDSTWSDPRTLAPRRHRSVQPGRRLFVDWNGRAIAGRVQPASGAPVVVDSTLAVPTFDSSNWELLVRAMDLGAGVRRVLPVYDVDGRLQWYTARVTDSTTVEGRLAWIIRAELGSAGTATLTIEQVSRRLASVDVPMGQGTLRMAANGR